MNGYDTGLPSVEDHEIRGTRGEMKGRTTGTDMHADMILRILVGGTCMANIHLRADGGLRSMLCGRQRSNCRWDRGW